LSFFNPGNSRRTLKQKQRIFRLSWERQQWGDNYAYFDITQQVFLEFSSVSIPKFLITEIAKNGS
jgi:hypothetical protein